MSFLSFKIFYVLNWVSIREKKNFLIVFGQSVKQIWKVDICTGISNLPFRSSVIWLQVILVQFDGLTAVVQRTLVVTHLERNFENLIFQNKLQIQLWTSSILVCQLHSKHETSKSTTNWEICQLATFSFSIYLPSKSILKFFFISLSRWGRVLE